MNRIDNSKFLLYIEPKKEHKSNTPINDGIIGLIKHALSKAVKGAANYSEIGESETFNNGHAYIGTHVTDCGERSSNCDYLLENGMITNSLCVFYPQYYRDAIPKPEMDKVYQLALFYKNTFL